MRGDPMCQHQRGPVCVSIRAPHFHAGRRHTPACRGSLPLFQSAPRTFMRGDGVGNCKPRSCISFNPRPALSCGATSSMTGNYNTWLVSIRAPHFHAGRPGQTCPLITVPGFNPRPALSCGATPSHEQADSLHGVSIRAPHFHAGRRRPGQHAGPDGAFQSAPRTFMRGDESHDYQQLLSSVSIRAPHFHAGRLRHAKRIGFFRLVSIRAPHFHAGRLEGCGLRW